MTPSGNRPTVVVYDSADAAHSSCQRVLSDVGYRVLTLEDDCPRLPAVPGAQVEVVVVDLRRPCDACLRLIREIRKDSQRMAIVVITSSPTVRDAVDLLKAGADEILPESYSSDELKAAVAAALRQRRDRSC